LLGLAVSSPLPTDKLISFFLKEFLPSRKEDYFIDVCKDEKAEETFELIG
jgi:hypothetical protein